MPLATLFRRTLSAAVLGLTLLQAAVVFAQSKPAAAPSYRLELRTGAVVPPNNVDEFFSSAVPTDIQGGVYYRIVQFWTPLTKQRLGRLEQSWGVKLLHYLPQNAWLVAFPASFNRYLLQGYSVRSVFKLEPEAKLALNLRKPGNLPAHAVSGTEVRLLVQTFENAAAAIVHAALTTAGATEIAYDSVQHLATVRVPIARIRAVAEQPLVLSVEIVPTPPQKEDRRGRSNHRVNYINADDYLPGFHAVGTAHVPAGLNASRVLNERASIGAKRSGKW